MLQEAIACLGAGDFEKARKLISNVLLEECISLIISKTNINNRNESLSVYYEALLIFCEHVQSGKFDYISDIQSKSYLKTICFNKAKEYERLLKGSRHLVSSDILEEFEDEFCDFYNDFREEEYKKKKERGADISVNKLMDTYPVAVVEAFHTLKEKCKLLIILKYKMNLKHNELVNILVPFYRIKNKDVSKVELQRCLNKFREEVKRKSKSNVKLMLHD